MLRRVMLLVLALGTPALGWQFDVPHTYEDCSRTVAPPVASGATAFVPVLDSGNCAEDRGELRLYALDLASGVLRWRWELDGGGDCQAGRIVGLMDGDPIVGATAWGCDAPESRSEYAVRVDAVTGAEIWRSPASAWALHDGDVIVATGGIVSRLDGETGTQVWAREFAEVGVTFADMASDAVIVELWNEYTGIRTLVRLDVEDGTELSRVDLGPLRMLTLDRAGHAIALGWFAVPEIVSLDASTGLERWRFPYITWWPDILRGPSVVAGSQGTLLLSGSPPYGDAIDLGVLALDPVTGTERWRWSMDGGMDAWDWNRSIVGLPDGDVLVSGSVTQRVYGGVAALARLSGDDGTLRFFTDRVLPARRGTNGAQARFIAPATDDTVVVTGEHYPIGEFSSTNPVAAAVLVSATTGARAPCGDGVVDPGEACDDANAIDGDGCDTNCTATACGNGVIDASEVCDPADPAWDVSCGDDCTSALACDAIDVQGSWELLGWCSIGAFTSAEITWRNDDVRLTQDCATGRVAITPARCTEVEVAYRLGVGASVPTHRATGTVGCDGTASSGQIEGFALQVPAPGEEPMRGVLELDAPVPLACSSRSIALTQTWSATLVEDRIGHAEIVRGTAALTFQPLGSDGKGCAAPSPVSCGFELRRTTPSPPEPPVGPPDPPAPPPDEEESPFERITPTMDGCADLRGGGALACALAAAWSSPGCDGVGRPPAVERALRHAERLLARPGTVRRLGRIRADVQRAAARGELSPRCARSMARTLRHVRALLKLRAD